MFICNSIYFAFYNGDRSEVVYVVRAAVAFTVVYLHVSVLRVVLPVLVVEVVMICIVGIRIGSGGDGVSILLSVVLLKVIVTYHSTLTT